MVYVYDRDRRLVAICENAHNVTETDKLNAIGSLTFTLPFDDPKNDYCRQMHYARWGDSGALYRILSATTDRAHGGSITYECEHVIATLLDNVMIGFHTVGGLGYYTRNVLQYILARQTAVNWVLGDCDFTRQFEYGFEQENLLSALFSVPTCFAQDYIWTYNTETYPWRISLKALNTTAAPALYIRAAKNMLTLTRTSDPRDLCTRLYPFGYGEGVNQLNIASINGGRMYLQAPASVTNEYGIIERVWVDRRYESAETLMATAQTMLNALQTPYEQYSVSYASINGDAEKIRVGERVRVHDPASGTDFTDVVVSVTLNRSNPLESSIEIANTATNIASSITDLANRQRIEAAYSQGATQIYSQSLQGNADTQNGLKMDFYVPSDMIHVNKLYAKIRIESFRAYSKATDAKGSASTSTSSGGSTSVSGGSTSTGTSSGGNTSVSGGSVQSSDAVTLPSSNMQADDQGGLNAKNHNHGIQASDVSGLRIALTDWNGTAILGSAGWVPSGAHIHGAHSHSVNTSHSHTIPSHSHSVNTSHSHTIPSHSHSVNTSHSHNVSPGIFKFGNPSTFAVYVNGSYCVSVSSTTGEIDLLPYLTSGGEISRGVWQSVEIVPNDLAYISINLYTQGFIQSRGGTTA
jgi:phage minor structural protein